MRKLLLVGAMILAALFSHAALSRTSQIDWDRTYLPSPAVVRKFFENLTPVMQSDLIRDYSKALWGLPKTQMLVRNHPARVYIHCNGKGCADELERIVRELTADFPKLFSGLGDDPATADIEVFVMGDDRSFRDRDRAVDEQFHANASYTRRSLPCNTAFYFDDRNASLATLAFIDSDLPRDNQILCLSVALAAAAGGFYPFDFRAAFTSGNPKQHRYLRMKIGIGLLFHEIVASSGVSSKEIERTLLEAFSLPPN